MLLNFNFEFYILSALGTYEEIKFAIYLDSAGVAADAELKNKILWILYSEKVLFLKSSLLENIVLNIKPTK